MRISPLLFTSILFGLLICRENTSRAQTAPKIIPLAPNAAEFSKYGNYQVSSVTGRPDISIPIYNITSGSLKLPISLSYFAGGIKVSQVATWVGLGWSLNAGGVISRTVRGLPDETNTVGWINDPTTASEMGQSADVNLIKRYADLLNDPAPDFFSYNLPTKSGKFIYRKSKHDFEAIPYNPIKIIRTPGAKDVENNYQIVDENGIKYYFNQKQNYSDDDIREIPASLKFYTQSWYLTKIISANNKDSILFRYETKTVSTILPNGNSTQPEWLLQRSYARTYYKAGNPEALGYGIYNDNGVTSDATSIATTEPTLKEIVFKNGKVVFNSLTGRKDYPGAMLDDLTIYSLTSTGTYRQIQKYIFTHDYFVSDNPLSQYDYRLKLNSIHRVDLNGNKDEVHTFNYNDVKLPSTLSTAQDYWGYYNGREQEFLPNVPPVNAELQQWYGDRPMGIADRTAVDALTQAGILTKITYPTGGYTIFNYEPNKYKSDISTILTISLSEGKFTGIGKRKPTVANYNFTFPTDAIENNGELTITFSPHNNPSAFDVAQKVTLTDVTTGSNIGVWEYQGDFTKTYVVNTGYTFIPTHDYKLTVVIDDDSPTYISHKLTVKKRSNSISVKSGSGLRIGSITNYDNNNSLIETTGYTYKGVYGEGIGMFFRKDKDFNENFYLRRDKVYDQNCLKTTMLNCDCLFYEDNRIIYVGQGSIPQVTFEGSSTVYDQVTKTTTGPNGEINGKIVYSLQIPPPNQASIYNPNVPGRNEYINNNMIDEGKQPSEKYYSYNKATGSYSLIRSIKYDYSPFHIDVETAFNVYRRVFFPIGCTNSGSLIDMMRVQYDLNFGCYKLTTITDSTYNLDASVTKKITRMFYDNPTHMQVSRTGVTNSDGKESVTVKMYANDYSSGTAFIDDMKAANEIAFPIEEVSYQNNGSNTNILGGTITQYLAGGNGLIDKIHKFESDKPVSLSEFKFSSRTIGSLPYGTVPGAFLADTRYKERLTFNKYDNQANLVMITPKDGTPTSYQWGYGQIYPVLECKNASDKNVFYQSFEETEGNSSVRDAYTGNLSKVGGYSRTISNLDNGNYVLRYWLKQGTSWTLQESNVVVNINIYTISINSSYQIDDVSFYPAGALITTYTYDPVIGMTSQTDAKGQTTYYEYDEFQRLKNMRDQNRYIIKNNTYNYKP